MEGGHIGPPGLASGGQVCVGEPEVAVESLAAREAAHSEVEEERYKSVESSQG